MLHLSCEEAEERITVCLCVAQPLITKLAPEIHSPMHNWRYRLCRMGSRYTENLALKPQFIWYSCLIKHGIMLTSQSTLDKHWYAQPAEAIQAVCWCLQAGWSPHKWCLRTNVSGFVQNNGAEPLMCCGQACEVGFWTVITVPTVITPYCTVQITVSHNYGVIWPVQDGSTVQYNFDRNLAVWLQNISFLFATIVYE